jgi:hypothetical protein
MSVSYDKLQRLLERGDLDGFEIGKLALRERLSGCVPVMPEVYPLRERLDADDLRPALEQLEGDDRRIYNRVHGELGRVLGQVTADGAYQAKQAETTIALITQALEKWILRQKVECWMKPNDEPSEGYLEKLQAEKLTLNNVVAVRSHDYITGKLDSVRVHSCDVHEYITGDSDWSHSIYQLERDDEGIQEGLLKAWDDVLSAVASGSLEPDGSHDHQSMAEQAQEQLEAGTIEDDAREWLESSEVTLRQTTDEGWSMASAQLAMTGDRAEDAGYDSFQDKAESQADSIAEYGLSQIFFSDDNFWEELAEQRETIKERCQPMLINWLLLECIQEAIDEPVTAKMEPLFRVTLSRLTVLHNRLEHVWQVRPATTYHEQHRALTEPVELPLPKPPSDLASSLRKWLLKPRIGDWWTRFMEPFTKWIEDEVEGAEADRTSNERHALRTWAVGNLPEGFDNLGPREALEQADSIWEAETNRVGIEEGEETDGE